MFSLIIVALGFAALLYLLFRIEVSSPIPFSGASGKKGAMMVIFIALVFSVVLVLAISLIFNRDIVVSFFKAIAYYFSIIFLR